MLPSPSVFTPIHLRTMLPSDANAVLAIYQKGIETGNATFTDKAPGWSDWDQGHIDTCRLVAEENGEVIGWAALSAVSSRAVYRGVAEVSIYISPDAKGRGAGSMLLRGLVAEAEAAGFWTLQAGIFVENEASIALHQNVGFRIVGKRERIGRMALGPRAGQWRDVVFMEKRSTIAGID